MREDTRQIVERLINLGYEGQHWDFKREWYVNKASILHDIMCMANSTDKQDSYIIIGVDNNCKIIGTKNDPNRRTTQMLNNFLGSIQFGGNSRPEVRVDTVDVTNHQIDIIVVKNSDHVPFTLAADYKDNNSNKTVHCSNVYTRIQDSNTPIDKTADQWIVDELYKKRLRINSDPMHKLSYVLDDLNSWEQSDNVNGQFYYTHDTNIQIRLICDGDDKIFNSADFLCKMWPSKSATYDTAQLIYNNLVIKEIEHAGLDEHRIDLVRPECEYIDISKASEQNPDYRKYYYIFEHSMLDQSNRFLLKSHYTYGQSEYMINKWLDHVIYFSNKDEKDSFDNYIKSLSPDFLLKIIDNTKCGFASEFDAWSQIDIDDYRATLAIKRLHSELNDRPSWEYFTISDLGTIVGGGTPPTRKPEFLTVTYLG